MVSRGSNPADTTADTPGDTDTAANGGTDIISSVAAAAFEGYRQIGTVPPRF